MNDLASQELVIAGWIAVGLYMTVILFFVVRGAMRITNISDYAVGSVAFSPVAVGLSLAASMTSAATFIINPGFVAYYGISGVISLFLMLPLGALISLVILTKGFRKFGNSVKSLTMAQWIGTRYQSGRYALFFAFLSLLLITFIVLICVGLTKVLSKALNVEELPILLGIVCFIFGYMMFGGANSMVYTNVIQAILMIIVAVILLTSGYPHFSEGVHGFLEKLIAIDPMLAKPLNPHSPLFRDLFEVVFCQMVVGVAIVCQPHIITKSLLLKSDRDVNRYLLTGVLVEILFFAVVIAGLYARLSFPDLSADGEPIALDGILSAYVVKAFPVYISLIVILGLISAGLSTLEGLIQSLSTTVTNDIILPLSIGTGAKPVDWNKSVSLVAVNKGVIIGLGMLSFVISYDQLINPDLSVGIFAQNGVYAYFSAAFVPVLFGTFLKKVPLYVPVTGSIVAVIVHFSVYYGRLTPYMQETVRNPGIAASLALLSSVAVSLVLFWLSKPKEEPELARQSPSVKANPS